MNALRTSTMPLRLPVAIGLGQLALSPSTFFGGLLPSVIIDSSPSADRGTFDIHYVSNGLLGLKVEYSETGAFMGEEIAAVDKASGTHWDDVFVSSGWPDALTLYWRWYSTEGGVRVSGYSSTVTRTTWPAPAEPSSPMLPNVEVFSLNDDDYVLGSAIFYANVQVSYDPYSWGLAVYIDFGAGPVLYDTVNEGSPGAYGPMTVQVEPGAAVAIEVYSYRPTFTDETTLYYGNYLGMYQGTGSFTVSQVATTSNNGDFPTALDLSATIMTLADTPYRIYFNCDGDFDSGAYTKIYLPPSGVETTNIVVANSGTQTLELWNTSGDTLIQSGTGTINVTGNDDVYTLVVKNPGLSANVGAIDMIANS